MATYNSVSDAATDYEAMATGKYVDAQANGKAPAGLGVGDQVKTAGGTYMVTGVNSDGSYKSEKMNNMANSGSIVSGLPTTASSSNNLSSYLTNAYNNSTASNLSALESAYNQSKAELQAEGAKIAPTYQAQKNATAADADAAQSNFNEVAAANGLNTGTSGQAALARSSVLTGNLADLNQAEADAKSANNLALANLLSSYKSSVAEAEASGNSELAQALYNEAVRQVEATTTAASENKQYAYSYAMELIQAGKIPSDSILAAAGIDKPDAQALASSYALQTAPASLTKNASPRGTSNNTSSGTSGGTSDTSSGTVSNETVASANQSAGENSDLFKTSVMTPTEWAKHTPGYKTYNDYIDAMITKWGQSGQLTTQEAAQLISYYGI